MLFIEIYYCQLCLDHDNTQRLHNNSRGKVAAQIESFPQVLSQLALSKFIVKVYRTT